MSNKEAKLYGTSLSIIATILLFYATSDLQSGYYQFLRIFITIISIFNAYLAYRRQGYFVSILLGAIAILFNPFTQVTLDKQTWQGIDVISGVVFVVYAIALWMQPDPKK